MTVEADVTIIGRKQEKTWAEFQEKSIAGVRFALVNSPHDSSRFTIVPFNAKEHQIPPQTPGEHYSQGSFDGGSVILRWGKEGEFLGAFIVLEEKRHQRFIASMDNWDYAGFLQGNDFSEKLRSAASDLLALQVATTIASGKKPTRIYERKSGRRVGPMGVALTADDKLMVTDVCWPWGPYLKEYAYADGANPLVFLDTPRREEITGKHFKNYGAFGAVGAKAREEKFDGKRGFDEAVVIGPYLIDAEGNMYYLNPDVDTVEKMLDVVLADGPGEDFVFVSPEGIIFINPADTNILKGTTREYITTHLAEALGMEVRVQAITVRDIKEKGLVPVFVGNAVKACPVGSLSFTDGEVVLDTRIDITMNEHAQRLVEQFNGELDGTVEPSDPSLLTPINIDRGFALLAAYIQRFPGALENEAVIKEHLMTNGYL